MNREVFQHLYEQYHADVFHFLIYLVGNRSVAEDLSHEVYASHAKLAGFGTPDLLGKIQ